jgi:hypothetical protein
MLLGETSGFVLSFNDVVLRVTFDELGIGRIGFGSASASLTDESLFGTVLLSSPDVSSKPLADLSFGLKQDYVYSVLAGKLTQPFQLSAFMTTSWKMFNVGMHATDITISDLDPIWRLLDLVST